MKQELQRKFFHIALGIFFLIIIYLFGIEQSFNVVFSLFFIGLIIALALQHGIKLPFTKRMISIVEREHEKHFPGSAALIFIFATLLILFFFKDVNIVLAALSVSIFADTLAALIGKKFGKHVIVKKKHYTKTVEGTLTCFVVALIILFLFVPLWIALIGSIIATAVEFLPVNDNIGIPLFVGVVLKLLL